MSIFSGFKEYFFHSKCHDIESVLLTENIRRRTAMNDLLNSPKGVVPESADRFYDYGSGKFK